MKVCDVLPQKIRCVHVFTLCMSELNEIGNLGVFFVFFFKQKTAYEL